MEFPKKFFHDRVILFLTTVITILLVVGVSLILLRFDVSKNPTTIVAWRPNISGSSYLSGKPIDIYAMAIFMGLTAVAAVVLGARVYEIKRFLALFIMASSALVLLLAAIVANSLISLQ